MAVQVGPGSGDPVVEGSRDVDLVTPAAAIVPTAADIAAAAEPPVAGYNPELERIEIQLLLEGIYRHYGFDFRAYAYASLRRRIWKRIDTERLNTISALQDRVLHDPSLMGSCCSTSPST